ncbi:recombinase family protein [Clostridium sp. C8-1-8]|uniref:recombinase family protein n=1 Tax=Clostridium sp. C8-1-8 TaxID=2698831 RepID=UPI00136A89E7|nr:recombinase family protein [Clostridium sp. C8-1-8]
MQKTFGYIRVSSSDQNIDRQLEDMLELGIDERDIYIDKQSGKDFNRPKYNALKIILRPGDVVYIKSIDRFGRNAREIKKEWEEITKEIGADIKVLDMPLLDTTQYKDLMGSFVSNVVLEVLSFVAEQERDSIRKRQNEGIKIAKAKGKHLGRPKAIFPEQWESVYMEWKSKNITAVKAMEKLNLKKSTFYKLVNECNKR